MTAEQNTATAKVPKGRSPSYPGISLGTAVQRTKVIYERFKQFQQPMKAYTDAWGYKAPTTGPATVTFSALKKYGLVEDHGSGNDRTAVLTQRAIDILMKPNPADDIRAAALAPPIHAEMWQRFKNDVPSDEALRYEFVAQRGFTESGLRDFLREWRDTLAFAHLDSSVTIDENAGEAGTEGDGLGDNPQTQNDNQGHQGGGFNPPPPKPEGTMSYSVPVAAGMNVTVEGAFPLTEQQWTQFLAVLSAMKPGLVAEPPPAMEPEQRVPVER
jgi:hypothetical protein